MPMWELGARYASEGIFKAPEDFSMLMVSEWEQLLDHVLDAQEVINQRKIESEKLANLEPPFIVDSIVPPMGWLERTQKICHLLKSSRVTRLQNLHRPG